MNPIHRRPRPVAARCAAAAAASILCVGAGAQERLVAPDAQALDWFGYDVAADGPYAAVGAWRDDDAGEATGAVHLVLAPGDAPPAHLQKLTLADGAAGDRFGETLALGDGGALVVVAAPGKGRAGAPTGAVVVFEAAGGPWVEVARLDAPGRSEGDRFGAGLGVQGDTVLVGAPRDDEFAPDGGALYVFGREAAGFVLLQKLAPADLGPHDYFGHDLALSGDRAVVTVYNDDDAGTNAGAAYVLERGGNGRWAFTQKLTGAEAGPFDLFGSSCALDGDTIVVGAPQNEDVDALARVDEGAAFVYEWSKRAGRWAETAVLRPGDPGDEHRFGIAVAVRGDVIAVGASHSDTGPVNAGSVHLFARRGRDRVEVHRHTAATPAAYDYLGLSVAIGAGAVVVGVPGAGDAAPGAGAVDVLSLAATPDPWASTFCHGHARVDGFRNMGGAPNSAGSLGRLAIVGSGLLGRDDMILRATGLPTGCYALLYVGGDAGTVQLQDGRFCVASGTLGQYRFPYELIGASGRHVVRRPMGRIEDSFPGRTAAMVGQDLYAQVLYYDLAVGAWNSTNAVRMRLAP